MVYVAAEGGLGIYNHVEAMKRAKPKICDHGSFYLRPSAIDLFQIDDVTALARLLPDIKTASGCDHIAVSVAAYFDLLPFKEQWLGLEMR